jgi:5'-methylthioadenosine phosphorylase
MVKIGIIGGSGLEDPNIMKGAQEKQAMTEFGQPSGPLVTGKISGVDVVLISRHGKKHEHMPTDVPYQANILALKNEGCTHILAATACGSLREEIKPGDFVFIDQFIDRTTKRASTFYDGKHSMKGVCHIAMADPFCIKLRNTLQQTAQELNLTCHEKGTMVTIEGPRFSTKAESHMFRQWKSDVINMTTCPEVVLAREAGVCYASVAMATDYDCWREGEHVDLATVLAMLKQNADNVTKLFVAAIPKIADQECACKEAIKTSVLKME